MIERTKHGLLNVDFIDSGIAYICGCNPLYSSHLQRFLVIYSCNRGRNRENASIYDFYHEYMPFYSAHGITLFVKYGMTDDTFRDS